MHHCSTICSYEYWKSRKKKSENLISRQDLFQDVSRYIKYVQTYLKLLQAWPFGYRDITHKIFKPSCREKCRKNMKQKTNKMAITSNGALFPIILHPPQKPRFRKNLPKQMGPYSGGVQYYRGGIMQNMCLRYPYLHRWFWPPKMGVKTREHLRKTRESGKYLIV